MQKKLSLALATLALVSSSRRATEQNSGWRLPTMRK